MPIQFNCTNCSSVLQVPDEYAGKSAKCPTCESVLSVPLAGSASAPDSLPPPVNPAPPQQPPALAQGTVNPYAPAASTKATAQVPGHPTHVPFGAIFNHASDVWREQLGILLGATVIVFGVSFVLSSISGILEGIGRDHNSGPLILASRLINIFGSLVNLFLGIGMARICLAASRRRRAEIGMLFGGGDAFAPILGTTILMGIASMIAVLLLIVPLILLWVFLWPFYYLIVDRQCGALDSFSRALEIAKPNAGTSFLMMLASIAIFLAGILAVCIGVLFAAPFIGVLWATAYLMMRGELSIGGDDRFALA